MVKKIYDSVAIAEVYTGESIIPEDCTELCAQANQLRRGILQALRNFEDKHRVADPICISKRLKSTSIVRNLLHESKSLSKSIWCVPHRK